MQSTIDPAAGGVHWDVFLSYCRTDAGRVQLLVRELRAIGLSVFRDVDGLAFYGSVSKRLTYEIEHSRLFVAYYSQDYADSRPCQEELLHAFLAGSKFGDALERILVLNPEVGVSHVNPLALRDDAHCLAAPRSKRALRETALEISEASRLRTDAIGPIADGPALLQNLAFPMINFDTIINRYREQWELHSVLNRYNNKITNGSSIPETAIVYGLPGAGKTTLVAYYAYRFRAYYPDGVVWLVAGDLLRHGGTVRSRNEDSSDELTCQSLLVIDDVAAGVDQRELCNFLCNHVAVPTIIICRDPSQFDFGTRISVHEMDFRDFTEAFSGVNTRDVAAVRLLRDIYDAGGGHAALLGALTHGAAKFGLRSVAEDVLKPASTLSKPVVTVLLNYIGSEGALSLDILRALCYLPLFISLELLFDAMTFLANERGDQEAVTMEEVRNELSRQAELGLVRLVNRKVEQSPTIGRLLRYHDSDWVSHHAARRAVMLAVSSWADDDGAPNLKFYGRNSTEERERRAAFNLQVLLATSDLPERIAQKLGLQDTFVSVSELLKAAQDSLSFVGASTTRRGGLRIDHLQYCVMRLFRLFQPILVNWGSRLSSYLDLRPTDAEILEYEKAWDQEEVVWLQLGEAIADWDEIRSELVHITGAGQDW